MEKSSRHAENEHNLGTEWRNPIKYQNNTGKPTKNTGWT